VWSHTSTIPIRLYGVLGLKKAQEQLYLGSVLPGSINV